MIILHEHGEDLLGRRPVATREVEWSGATLAELAPVGCHLALYAGDLVRADDPEWKTKVPVDGAVIRFSKVPHGDSVGDVAEIVGGIVNPGGIILDTLFGEGGQVGDFLRGLTPDFIRNSPFANLGGLFSGFFGGGNMASLGSTAPLGATDSSPSPTYSFGSIGNVFSDGAPVPLVYGEHRIGGAVIHLESFADQYGELLMYSILLGEGPFERIGKWDTDQTDLFSDADPNGNHSGLYLNNRPAWTIPNIYMSLRLGTAGQTSVMQTTAQRYGYGLVLDEGIYFKHVTDKAVHGVRLIFRAPSGLFFIDQTTGERGFQEASFQVTFYDESGALVSSATRNVTLGDNGSISPYFYSLDVLDLDYGRYTVQCVRVGSEEYTQATNVADKVEIYVLNEYVFAVPSFKNRAVLTIKVRASEDLSGFPQTTILCRGRKVYNADTAATEWTRNPAWIARDVMTFKRGGLGSRITEAEIDDDALADFADEADELIPTFTDAPTCSPLVLTTGTGAVAPTMAGTWSSTTKWGTFTAEVTSFSAGVSVGLKFTFILDPELNAANEIYNTSHTNTTPQTVAYGVTAVADPAGSWSVGAIWSFSIQREPRYRLDVVIDQRRSGWRWIQDLCGTARASMARIGNRYVAIRGNQRLPVACFNESSNILEDTLQITTDSTSQRDNTVEIQFLDASANYKQASVTIESDAVAFGLEDQRRAVYQMPGITRITQAARMAAFFVRGIKLGRSAFAWEAGIDSMGVYPGQVVRVVSNRELYAKSGRIVSATGSSVTLDREVALLGGRPYVYIERKQDNSFDEVSFTVVSDVTTATINVPPFDADPTGNPWAICQEGEAGYDVLVTRISAGEGLARQMEGVLYLDEIYSDDGNPSGAGQAVPVAPSTPNHVTSFAVVESIEADTNRSIFTLGWTAAIGGAQQQRIWVKVEGQADFALVDVITGTATSYEYRGYFTFGNTITFLVQTANGSSAALFSTAPEVALTVANDAGTLRVIPAAPATFTATPGGGNDVTLAWAAVSGADGYEVRAGTWSAGPVVYRGASTSTAIKATRRANRFLVRAYKSTIYSKACLAVETAATALAGYATQAGTYVSTLDDLVTAGAVAVDWHIQGRGLVQVSDALPVTITSPSTDLGSSAATQVSVAFRAIAVPYVVTQTIGVAPFYLMPEGDVDVRIVAAPLVLQHSPDGSTWTSVPFSDVSVNNLLFGADVIVTARYFRFSVAMASNAVANRVTSTITERRGLPLIEQINATFYRA